MRKKCMNFKANNFPTNRPISFHESDIEHLTNKSSPLNADDERAWLRLLERQCSQSFWL